MQKKTKRYTEYNPKTKRQKQVVSMYKSGMTYQKIADELGITRQAVGYLMREAAFHYMYGSI
jgi:DNA-binding CsgD family transcriptional regulator